MLEQTSALIVFFQCSGAPWRVRVISRTELSSDACSDVSAMAASAGKKLLRSISGISGVSDRALSKVLTWVKDHPEVLEQNVSHQAVRLCECMLRCLPPFSRIVAVPPAFAHHAPSLTLKTSSTRAVETAEAIISNDSPPPIIKASSTLAVSTAKAIMFNTSPLSYNNIPYV